MRSVVLLCCCLYYFDGSSQSTFRSGLLPHVNISVSPGVKWKFNTKVETRQTFIRSLEDHTDVAFLYDRTDIALLITRRTGTGTSLSGGYQIRLQNAKPEHRLIQQYAFSSAGGVFRVAHRIAADQTFVSGENPQLRFRYRISAELPLNGQSTDPGEWYLKLNQETLPALQSSDFSLELRALAAFGMLLTDSKKIEFGIDYRLSEFIENEPQHAAWLSLGSFLSF